MQLTLSATQTDCLFLLFLIIVYVSFINSDCVALVRRDSVVIKDDVQSLQKMIRNEDQFDMMFMESIRESEANF